MMRVFSAFHCRGWAMQRSISVLFLLGLLGSLACMEIAGPVSALQKSCERQADCPGEGRRCHEGYCLELPVACDGDGLVEAGEACDDGNDSDEDGCTVDCQLARCGDGLLREDLSEGASGFEACDDGNEDNSDACLNNCRLARCGDGVVAMGEGEACDDGNQNDFDECLSHCRLAACGDGFLREDRLEEDPGFEFCDDGNEVDTDGCRSDCSLPRCGDGVLRGDQVPGALDYEECDDGNAVDGDACSSDCKVADCGDGLLWVGEEACDDGNRDEADACRNDCTENICGDGVLNPEHEACDDGNDEDEDGCLNSCELARCGDGVLRRDLEAMTEEGFESCEPDLDNGRLYCRPDCRYGRKPRSLALVRDGVCVFVEGQIHCRSGQAVNPGPRPMHQELWPVEDLLTVPDNSAGHLCAVFTGGRFSCHRLFVWDRMVTASIPGQVVDLVGLGSSSGVQAVVTANGEVRTWDNQQIVPRVVDDLRDIVRLAGDPTVGGLEMIAIDRDGQVWELDGLDRVRALDLGTPMMDVIRGSYTAPGWSGFYTYLGRDGLLYHHHDRGDLQRVEEEHGPVLQVVGDWADTTCFMLDNAERSVRCYGSGDQGALGQGDEVAHYASVEVPEAVAAIEIVGDARGFCVLKEDRSVWCWGANHSGRFVREERWLPPTPIEGFPPP